MSGDNSSVHRLHGHTLLLTSTNGNLSDHIQITTNETTPIDMNVPWLEVSQLRTTKLVQEGYDDTEDGGTHVMIEFTDENTIDFKGNTLTGFTLGAIPATSVQTTTVYSTLYQEIRQLWTVLGGALVSNLNSATGTTGTNGSIGGVIVGTASNPILSFVANTVDINGGQIDATPIGAGTPASGEFTSLSCNSSCDFKSMNLGDSIFRLGGSSGTNGQILQTNGSTLSYVDGNDRIVSGNSSIVAVNLGNTTFTGNGITYLSHNGSTDTLTVGATTTLNATTADFTNFDVGHITCTGGNTSTIDDVLIGNTTPAYGRFTTLETTLSLNTQDIRRKAPAGYPSVWRDHYIDPTTSAITNLITYSLPSSGGQVDVTFESSDLTVEGNVDIQFGELNLGSSVLKLNGSSGSANQILQTDGTYVSFVDRNADRIVDGNSSIVVNNNSDVQFTGDGTQFLLYDASENRLQVDSTTDFVVDNELYVGRTGNYAILGDAHIDNKLEVGKTNTGYSTITAYSDVNNVAADILLKPNYIGTAIAGAYIYSTYGDNGSYRNNAEFLVDLPVVDGAFGDYTSLGTQNVIRVDFGGRHYSRSLHPIDDDQYTLGHSNGLWNELFCSNATINTSDRRYKKDISYDMLGLDFLEKLKPCSYKWKNGVRTHHGMIAQEVKEVLKQYYEFDGEKCDFAGYIYEKTEASENEKWNETTKSWDKVYTEEKDYYGLRYGEFISPIIKGVQELSQREKNLNMEVKGLESRVSDLETKITQLESENRTEIDYLKEQNEMKDLEIAEMKEHLARLDGAIVKLLSS